MSGGPAQFDLVVLVPGRDEQAALEGILDRPAALGIRAVSVVYQRHPDRDPGCFLRAHDFLRSQARRARHALVMFDRQGCGQEGATREDLERTVEGRLAVSGWGDRAAVVVIDPELEVWVWSDSPRVADGLGWRQGELDAWLREQGFLVGEGSKPSRPKEAVQGALSISHKRRSSAIYRELAASVSLHSCTDPAFRKLRDVLVRWFGLP